MTSGTESAKIEIIFSNRGRPSLTLDGHRYRVHRKKRDNIRWVCLRERSDDCRGGLITDHSNNVLRLIEHTCKANFVEIELKKALSECKSRARTDLDVPIPQIFNEVFAKFQTDEMMKDKLPKYDSVKAAFYNQRRLALNGELPKSFDDEKPVEKKPQIFPCTECQETFTKKKSLREHMNDCHAALHAVNPVSGKSSDVEIVISSKGKPSLILNGYRYRRHRSYSGKTIRWACSKERSDNCRGSLITDANNVVLRQSEHCCKANFIEVEVKKALIRCKKRAQTDVFASIRQIFDEEFAKFQENDKLRAFIPEYMNVKAALYRNRKISRPKYVENADVDVPFSEIEFNEELPSPSRCLSSPECMPEETGGTFQCAECNKIFTHRSYLTRHLKSIHSQIGKIRKIKQRKKPYSTISSAAGKCIHCPHCNMNSGTKRNSSTQTDLSFPKYTRLTHIFSADGEIGEVMNPRFNCDVKQENMETNGTTYEDTDFHPNQSDPLGNMDRSVGGSLIGVEDYSDTLETLKTELGL